MNQEKMKATIKAVLLLLTVFIFASCASVQTPVFEESPAPVYMTDAERRAAMLAEHERLKEHARVLFHLSQGYIALGEGNIPLAFGHFDQLEQMGITVPEILRTKALVFILAGDIPRAMNELDRAVAADPEDVDTLFLKAGLLATVERLDEAAALYQDILDIDPTYEEAAVFLAAIYEEQGHPKKMRKLLEEFTEANPQAGVAWYELGRLYLQAEQWEEAKNAFSQAARINPDYILAWIGLGFSCEELNDREGAIQAYQTALDLKPTDRVIRQELINLYIRSNDPDAAMAEIDRLEILGGGLSETRISRGIVLYQQGETLAALAEFNQVLEQEPDNQQALYLVGLCLSRLNRIDQAIETYEKIPRDSAYYYSARVALAYLLVKVSRGGDALAMLDLLEQDNPDDADILRARATVLSELGRYEQAEEALQRARKLQPDDTDVIYSLAMLYERTGRWQEAIEMMEKILEQNPNDANALNFIGYTLADHESDLPRAEKLLARAMELQPYNGFVIDSYGWALYRQGRYEQALEYLLRAATLEPSEAVITEHVGDAYAAMGNQENAVVYWRKALQLNPDQKTKQRLKEKLGE